VNGSLHGERKKNEPEALMYSTSPSFAICEALTVSGRWDRRLLIPLHGWRLLFPRPLEMAFKREGGYVSMTYYSIEGRTQDHHKHHRVHGKFVPSAELRLDMLNMLGVASEIRMLELY
jgi:hypothetical protein